jgi:protein SYS1
MIMDWRELAGRPTVRGLRGPQRWDALTGVWSGGVHIGHQEWASGAWDGRVDPMRGWVIALCWIVAFGAEYVFPPYTVSVY